ncbi:MAG: choloylglycine hydrolase [Clostridia bacterium]|nr:choloylglycine hydrolase [Clostridia bacterium]
MCTAISFNSSGHYFGRNLDFEYPFGEKIAITPRNYPFKFTNGTEIKKHYAIIGMALPAGGYPLYFDGTNEKGLSMAGLNFPGYAFYNKPKKDKENIASFEVLPWILSRCGSVDEAEKLLGDLNITDEPFNKDLEPSELHFMIADKRRSITVEQTSSGLKVYENPVGVLTNNPTFDIQLFNLNNYMALSNKEPENTFSDKTDLENYSRGMGAIGLPGDYSSMSRFVRACFTKLNSVCGESEVESVSQFFHILYSVYQQRGCVRAQKDYVITHYTSCCNTDKGIYYYTTYNNSTINAVDMYKENLESDKLIIYDKRTDNIFYIQN